MEKFISSWFWALLGKYEVDKGLFKTKNIAASLSQRLSVVIFSLKLDKWLLIVSITRQSV